MGYDCTMHVIDEERIRGRFVDRLLRPTLGKDAFDKRADAKELWGTVRKLLKSGPASDAAQAVAQLAVVFSAAELPYHYERGFCLSLWDSFPMSKSAPIPKGCIGNPEELFTRLLEKFPKMSGRFPREIESNFCTGYYVPRDRVPVLLEWARQQDTACDLEHDGMFRGLILILEHALKRNLGYWEATDLPLDLETIRPSVSTPGVDQWEYPEQDYAHVRAMIDQTVFLTWGPGETCWTTAVDISTWPPRFETVLEFTVGVARSAEGKLLTVSADRGEQYHYRARVREGKLSATPRIIPLANPRSPNGLSSGGGFVGERVVGFESPSDRKRGASFVPLIERDGKLVETRGVAPLTERDVNEYGSIRNEGCTAQLGNGTDLILWNGEGYALSSGVTLKRVVPGVGKIWSWECAVFPWGPDGFLYAGEAPPERHTLGGREIKLARPGMAPIPVGLAMHNVVDFNPGPDGSIIVSQVKNKKRYLGAIWYLENDTFIPVEPKVFADEDPNDIHHLFYSQATGLLIAATEHRFWSTPIAPLLEADRLCATTGRKIKVTKL